jgi:hypothetical protein
MAACILGEEPGGATVEVWDVFFTEFLGELLSRMGRAKKMAAGFRRCIKKRLYGDEEKRFFTQWFLKKGIKATRQQESLRQMPPIVGMTSERVYYYGHLDNMRCQ